MAKSPLTRAKQITATVALILAIAYALRGIWKEQIIWQWIYASLTGNSQQVAESWNMVDRLVAAVPSNNVVLRFDGFNPNKPKDVIDIQQFYVRGSYWLYPRRLYFAEDGAIIRTGRDVLEAKFDPTVGWIRAHDAQGLLRMVLSPESQVSFHFDSLPEEQQSR